MKIIFLDHDGPMVIPGLPYFKTVFNSDNSYFDPNAVKILNEILEKTNAEIVVSSDWRKHYNLSALGDIYEEAGICKKPIDVTPLTPVQKFCVFSSLDEIRSYEINMWLSKNKNITTWVAIDDLYLNVKNFVWTDEGILGITEKGIKEKILEFLM